VTLTVFNRERHLLKKPKPNLHEELQRLTHEAKAILFLKCEASRLCHERRCETCATVAWTTMWCQRGGLKYKTVVSEGCSTGKDTC